MGDSTHVGSYIYQLRQAMDYLSFGDQMQGRFVNSGYRYGFNGKQDDDNVKGNYKQIDYGARIYDPRVARFLSVDPYLKEYCDLSPYHFSGNNPIKNLDKDGGEPKDFMENWKFKKFSVNGGTAMFSRNVSDPQLGLIDVEAVFDNWTTKTWFIHQGNDGRNYYWKHNPGADQSIRIAGNGKWAEFQTQNRIRYEQNVKIARGLSAFYAAAIAAPFTWAGIVELGSAASAAIGNTSVKVIAAATINYYRYAPAIGALGNLTAEALDESGGSVSTGASGSRVVETTINEVKEFLNGKLNYTTGNVFGFFGNAKMNGKPLKLQILLATLMELLAMSPKMQLARGVLDILTELKRYAKSKGFGELKVEYQRAVNSSSATPGHTVSKVFNLSD